jgi:RNA polymerase sigma-70 factor, ECF subfamily
VFLKALDALTQYRPQKGPFVAWLFGIARHAATNFAQRSPRTVAWEYLGPESAMPMQPNDLEECVLRQESLLQVRRLCAALDPSKQELLALRFVVGLTSAEIGATIGKSEAAVKKQLTRILHRLKEQYDDLSS